MQTTSKTQTILAIDIGGSNIKSTILDAEGKLLTDYKHVATPVPSTPENILATIKDLIKGFPPYDKISTGFPGYVKDGVVQTAPNLGTGDWHQCNLSQQLSDLLGKPALVINDADMQGLSIVSGKGFEIMITLGTGFGTAFLHDGVLLPHIELAHHPVTKSKDYDEYVGDKAFKKKGAELWNIRVKKVLDILKTVFNYDRLYIGGGNSKHINFELPGNVKIVTNQDGIKGGAILWKQVKH